MNVHNVLIVFGASVGILLLVIMAVTPLIVDRLHLRRAAARVRHRVRPRHYPAS
jgi:hypothetical protein